MAHVRIPLLSLSSCCRTSPRTCSLNMLEAGGAREAEPAVATTPSSSLRRDRRNTKGLSAAAAAKKGLKRGNLLLLGASAAADDGVAVDGEAWARFPTAAGYTLASSPRPQGRTRQHSDSARHRRAAPTQRGGWSSSSLRQREYIAPRGDHVGRYAAFDDGMELHAALNGETRNSRDCDVPHTNQWKRTRAAPA